MTNTDKVTQSTFWSNLFKAPTEKEDLESVLSGMPPFKDLKEKYIKQLLNLIHNRVYQPNEYIFMQGDPGIGLFIIREGEIVITYTDEDSEKYELATFTRGDFFGELAMLDDSFRSASAIAHKESNVAVIFKPDLDEFMNRYPKQGNKILLGISKIVTTRLRLVNEEYFDLYRRTSKK